MDLLVRHIGASRQVNTDVDGPFNERIATLAAKSGVEASFKPSDKILLQLGAHERHVVYCHPTNPGPRVSRLMSE